MSTTFEIEIEKVIYDDQQRQRKELTSITELAESIRRLGLINAIVLGPENKLIAGRRRLEACRELGHRTITARYYESLDTAEQRLVELDENLRRVDLPWQETVFAIAELHQLKFQQSAGSWNQGDTAEYSGLSGGVISEALLVHRALQGGDEKVNNCNSARQAAELLRRRRQLALDTAFSKEDGFDHESEQEDWDHSGGLEQPEQPAEPSGEGESEGETNSPVSGSAERSQPNTKHQVLCTDFSLFAPTYSGPRFNLIHCDFPYGINLEKSNAANSAASDTQYSDSSHLFWGLTEALLQNQERLVLPSAHMIFWFSMTYYEKLKTRLEEAGWFVVPHPLVWVKSCNSGIASDYRRRPRHAYETAFFCSLGDRIISSLKSDFYSCPIAKVAEGHISAKPVEMLSYFLSMICDENTDFFDPTCGSGTSARAALSLSAARSLSLEINKETAEGARLKLLSAQREKEKSE